MEKHEKKLFRQLCDFKYEKLDKPEAELLKYASPEVLGQLFFNRMQGVAYGVLKKSGFLNKTNREFRNSLEIAYKHNICKNNTFFKCIQYISDIFKTYNFDYAMLKGALLCAAYPDGYRTSNDIDILVNPEDIPQIESALNNAGFMQGYIKNDEFISASRRMIIESRMTRGEIVPFIKKVDFPGMKYLEVDINFSLDYKPGNSIIVKQMLDKTHNVEINSMHIRTLSKADFFIHLCMHLYKESATLPWIRMNRDMTLYKYCDIYMLLNEMNSYATSLMFKRSSELGLDMICAFAILYTAAFFTVTNDTAIARAKKILDGNTDFLHTVFSPEDKKLLIYKNKDICARFFCKDRQKILKEVHHENIKNES